MSYHFKKIKAPTIPYFSIFNRIKPQQLLFRAFFIERKPEVHLIFAF